MSDTKQKNEILLKVESEDDFINAIDELQEGLKESWTTTYLGAFGEIGDMLEDMQNGEQTEIKFDMPKPASKAKTPEENAAEAYLQKYKTPIDIKKELDRKVYKQDEAKTIFSELIFEKAIDIESPYDGEYKQPVVLMCGPTGCGKTYIAEVARETKPPFPIEIIDASMLTSPGFKGTNVDELLINLFKTNPSIENGIIVFDEFDKLCIPRFSGQGDNVNAEIQSSLLKMMDGTTMNGRIKSVFEEYDIAINTRNITFVLCGSFGGFLDTRKKDKGYLGFGASAREQEDEENIREKLIEYGMMPEIAGRIGIVSKLAALNEEDYVHILNMKENRLAALQEAAYRYYGIKLKITQEAKREVARMAMKMQLGARGAYNIIETTYRNNIHRMLLTRSENMVVTDEMIRKTEAFRRYQERNIQTVEEQVLELNG